MRTFISFIMLCAVIVICILLGLTPIALMAGIIIGGYILYYALFALAIYIIYLIAKVLIKSLMKK